MNDTMKDDCAVVLRERNELSRQVSEMESYAQIRESDWLRLFNRKNELEEENVKLRAEVAKLRQSNENLRQFVSELGE